MRHTKRDLVTLIAAATLMSCDSKMTRENRRPSNSCNLTYETLYTDGFLNRETIKFEGLELGGFELGMPDSHYLVRTCGFQYYGNRTGGTGNTLEIIGGPEESIYFVWIGNGLSRICLRGGWQGETELGLKIGDSFANFINLYPSAKPEQLESYFSQDQRNLWSANHLKINFDREKRISCMEIDAFPRAGTPIGPWDGNWR